MKLFEPSTISAVHCLHKSSILDVPLCSEYASGTINYFRNRLHLDVWLSSRYTADMFKERQKLWKTCKGVILETLHQRLRNNFKEISEKSSTEKWFSSQLFSASFVRNPALRDVLWIKLFFTISRYLQESTCVRVPFW